MKKRKFIVLILLITILAAGGYAGYLYLKTDFFKSNKEVFFRNLSQIDFKDVEYLKRYKELYTKLENANYSSMRSCFI